MENMILEHQVLNFYMNFGLLKGDATPHALATPLRRLGAPFRTLLFICYENNREVTASIFQSINPCSGVEVTASNINLDLLLSAYSLSVFKTFVFL